MSLVSSRLSLIHRTTLQRDQTTDTDDWGTPGAPDWQDEASDVPCRFWTASGREQLDATTTVVVEDMRMVVPVDTDVTERDRVGDVTYRGDTIAVGPIGIRAVIHHRDFLELVLIRLA